MSWVSGRFEAARACLRGHPLQYVLKHCVQCNPSRALEPESLFFQLNASLVSRGTRGRWRVVNCRCRRCGASALDILNFKDGNLILINLLLCLVSLGWSQRESNGFLLRGLFSTAFFWFLWHIKAGFGFYPRLSSLLRCPAKSEYYHRYDVGEAVTGI